METKTNPLLDCEIKFAKSGWKFEGYASKFGGVDSYNDTIHKGAYKNTLKNREKPVFMRYEHMIRTLPPGKWLHLSEDDSGLLVAGELTKGQSLATDIRASMEHGTLEGLSIGFLVPSGGSKEEEDGIRHLHEIDLREISIVQNPADTGAVVTAMKSEINSCESIRELEAMIRDVERPSASTAKCFVSRLKTLVVRDVRAEVEEEIAELKARIETDHSTSSLVDIINRLKV